MSFEIKLPLFEGPFDLLLFFIERDELDIHDIPIFKITNDFMAYITELEQLNIEVASEFILIAATLMRIKAKLLLPRAEKDDQGNEIDPRKELVQHLLEYKKYKNVLTDLARLEDRRLMMETRGNIPDELQLIAKRSNLDYELQDLNLYKLMRVYEKAMNRFEEEQNRPKHTVYTYPYTIEDQKSFILKKVTTEKEVDFLQIVQAFPDKIGLIFNFLAILDMLQLNIISIRISDGFNNFRITPFEENQAA
ncbi:segregation and condensation protein A [Adhaeribacter rhizoryzae]|uniref:Segregation and condensation protein A n=1 Tax=Adhaeribacter rhizoryzae TaxID=2607907 RepID=A0A5M6CX54_9BACT|nr:segregation/condensation protein A [Adhaeribacter rhizoryzae]KAA5539506.1 chromosome segregation protein ScpA [Adhaeribacter rhizoryzae]